MRVLKWIKWSAIWIAAGIGGVLAGWAIVWVMYWWRLLIEILPKPPL